MNNSLRLLAKKYNTLTDTQKKAFLNEAYHGADLSYPVIAEACGTYANKVRRDGVRLGIKSKDKSQAQKTALKSGRHKHPTKGQKGLKKPSLR